MKLTSVGISLVLSMAGCGHATGGSAATATTVSAASVAEPPVMRGTCTVTNDAGVDTYTYEENRLTLSTATALDFRTVYTYEGARLTRIVRTIGGELAFRRQLEYDASGRLTALVTLTLSGLDRTALRESERRVFEYDAAGRVQRVTDTMNGAETTRVCVVEHDPQGRLSSVTCEVPSLEDEGPERTTFQRDAAGRLAEERMPFTTLRRHYDASGRLVRIEAISDAGGVFATEVTARDATGNEYERRVIAEGREDVVTPVAFDGTFGPGATCAAIPPAPPGLSDDVRSIWFDMAP
jgi:YD repeat-containing protein